MKKQKCGGFLFKIFELKMSIRSTNVALAGNIMIALLFVREDGRVEYRSVYRFEEPTDWADDSTVSDSRKQYYEEVYVVEIEDWKRDHM